MSRFGSAQVRASGTVGGNIANGSPIGDLAPALIAVGARVELRKGDDLARACRWRISSSPTASRTARPANMSRALEVPLLGYDARLSRLQGVEALRRGHFRGDGRLPSDAGGPAHRRRAHRLWRHGGDAEARRATPKRRSSARASTIPRAGAPARAAIASDFTPLTDMRASAAYRSEVAANLLIRALMEISGAERADPHRRPPCCRIESPSFPSFRWRAKPRSSTSRTRMIPRACMCAARRPISTTSASPRARCMSASAWPTRRRGRCAASISPPFAPRPASSPC